jgi:hypothetical protein
MRVATAVGPFLFHSLHLTLAVHHENSANFFCSLFRR